jgi:DNA-binding IscR family transcriptional regulator
MKINKKLEIAINTMSALRSKPLPARSADLAREVGTTENFMEQIMRQLRIAGLVDVKRGPGGGYFRCLKDEEGVSAHMVARAVGVSILSQPDTSTAAGKLSSEIAKAYLNTTI